MAFAFHQLTDFVFVLLECRVTNLRQKSIFFSVWVGKKLGHKSKPRETDTALLHNTHQLRACILAYK